MTAETVEQDVVVSVHYKLTLDDGSVVEESESDDPLMYLHGHDNIIPGLERGLEGLKVGDSKAVIVEPADGYGEYDPEDMEEVPTSDLPDDFKPEVGMILHVSDEEENHHMAIITEVKPESIMLDFNHPMAGKRLHFDVTIAGLRAATSEELAHGHVHDAHGHGH